MVLQLVFSQFIAPAAALADVLEEPLDGSASGDAGPKPEKTEDPDRPQEGKEKEKSEDSGGDEKKDGLSGEDGKGKGGGGSENDDGKEGGSVDRPERETVRSSDQNEGALPDADDGRESGSRNASAPEEGVAAGTDGSLSDQSDPAEGAEEEPLPLSGSDGPISKSEGIGPASTDIPSLPDAGALPCEADACVSNAVEIRSETSSASETGGNVVESSPSEDPDTSESSVEGSEGVSGPDGSVGSGGAEGVASAGDMFSADGTDASAAVVTGDSEAAADVVNDVNATVFGTNWKELIYDISGKSGEDIDLLKAFADLLKNPSPAVPEGGNGTVGMEIDNRADLETAVSASAGTGGNAAASDSGSASIETGDASARASVVNLANRTLGGDNWLFSVINVFGEWTGNLLVPGEGVLEIPGLGYVSLFGLDIDNEASVANVVSASADTGRNAVSGEGGSSSVVTGDADATAVAETSANMTLAGDGRFTLVVNDFGNWTGGILGASGPSDDGAFRFGFGPAPSEDGSEGCSAGCAVKRYLLKIRNVADIATMASATADTGGNSAEAGGGEASIRTGNASARSGVVNFVNNTIVGNNWMFVLLNVFGSWTGDLEFGYPDLAVTVTDSRSEARSGETLTYAVAYANEGKADARRVELRLVLPEGAVFFRADGTFRMEGREVVWDFSELAPGARGSVSVTAAVRDGSGGAVLVTEAGIRSGTAERRLDNNRSSDGTSVHAPAVEGGSETFSAGGTGPETFPRLKVERRNVSEDVLRPGGTVVFFLEIENAGDTPLAGVLAKDEVRDGLGAAAGTYEWPVGDLAPGERAIIEYSVQAGPEAAAGRYASQVFALGYAPDGRIVQAHASGRWEIAPGFLPAVQAGPPAVPDYGPEAVSGSLDSFRSAPAVAGASSDEPEPSGIPRPPLWMFLGSLVGYFLVVNRSFFPDGWRGASLSIKR
jgi:uncharacterized repeat protein (TIGR01451 family)